MFKCEWLMQNNMTFTHVCCRSTNNQQKVRKRHDQKICFQGMSLQLIAWKRKCIGKVRIWRNSMTHSKMQPPIFFCVCAVSKWHFTSTFRIRVLLNPLERERERKEKNIVTQQRQMKAKHADPNRLKNGGIRTRTRMLITHRAHLPCFLVEASAPPFFFNDIND